MSLTTKDHVVSKLLFPRVVLIDKPGLIINSVSQKFSIGKAKKRIVYFPKDLFFSPYKRTAEHLGEKQANQLWYEIGYRGMAYYFSVSVKPTLDGGNQSSILTYIFSNFQSAGIGPFQSVGIEGEVCTITQLTEGISPSLIALTRGVIDATLYFLKQKEYTCTVGQSRGVLTYTAQPSSEKKEFGIIDPTYLKSYNKRNIDLAQPTQGAQTTLKQLLAHKKASINSYGRLSYNSVEFMVFEIGFLEAMYERYEHHGCVELLHSCLLDQGQAYFVQSIAGETSKLRAMSALKSFFLAFGYGAPHISLYPHSCKVKIFYPPKTTHFSFFLSVLCSSWITAYTKKNVTDFSLQESPLSFSYTFMFS